MINGMYLSTMGAMVQTSRHGVVANNLANASTTGFKPDWAVFRSIPAESAIKPKKRTEIDGILERTGGGVWMDATATNFKAGPMQHTGNPLNLALRDEGREEKLFFGIRPQDGETTRYTRDGHFHVNEDGRLVTPSGDYVLSPAGEPVEIPPGLRIKIAEDGSVVDLEGNEVVAQVGIFSTDRPDGMTKLGDNLFEAGEAEFAAAGEGILPETLESSATEPVLEMAHMIEAHRAYETNMSFLRMQDETLGDVVGRLGRIA